MSNHATKKAVILLLLSAFIATAKSSPLHVMSWGYETPASRDGLVNELRIGCSAKPRECVNRILKHKFSNVDSISLSIIDKKTESKLLERSLEYPLILKNQNLINEISIDDFKNFAWRIKKNRPDLYLLSIIKNLKSNSSNLKFGITLYDYEINAITHSYRTPIHVRELVDRVALYIHNRKSVESYLDTLDRTRKAFPNAKIYAGVYHYDRRNYTSCEYKSGKHCSAQDEWKYYLKALSLQIELVKQRKIDGLELYPGRFTQADKWNNWSLFKACPKKSQAECVQQSERMTNTLLRVLSNQSTEIR